MKPEDTEALFALGVIYMKKEMYDNAMDTFYQVVKGAAEPKLRRRRIQQYRQVLL